VVKVGLPVDLELHRNIEQPDHGPSLLVLEWHAMNVQMW